MEMNIKCEKCGHLNVAEPESQCSNCGEYLYQFYLRTRNKSRHRKTSAVVAIIAVMMISLFLFRQYSPKKDLLITDPVQKDLMEYLKQIKIQRETFSNSNIAKNYMRNVSGLPDDNDQKVILAKMGLQDVPDSTKDLGVYEKYLKMWGDKSEQILKSKSLKERFRLTRDYYRTEANYYSQITPVTNEVESIHKYLIRSKELAAKAHENFLNGMNLGYISNVKETKDGIRWSYTLSSREHSDNYKNYSETSENESKAYFRMLEQLVLKYNLLKEYKLAYPFEGYVKENNLKKSQIKQ